ncbi:19286_t:CDS:1, partial [Funneliformis geosporum]
SDGIVTAAAVGGDNVFAVASDDDDDDGITVTAADISGDAISGDGVHDATAVGDTDGDAGIIDDAATYFYKENLKFI